MHTYFAGGTENRDFEFPRDLLLRLRDFVERFHRDGHATRAISLVPCKFNVDVRLRAGNRVENAGAEGKSGAVGGKQGLLGA